MPLFGRKSIKVRAGRSAFDCWRSFSAAAKPSLPDLEDVIASAQRELPSRVGYSVLASAYLVGAELAGIATVPTDEACRFAGLAAVVVKRGTSDVELPIVITRRYQTVRGKLRGSVFVPRDVEEAFAGRIERLEANALDARAFESVRTLARRVRRPAELDAEARQFMSDVGNALQT